MLRRGRPRRGADRHPVQRPRADGPGRARAGPARLLREAVDARAPTTSDELTALARERGLVTQVGYHNRFVGAFREVKRAARRRRDRRGHARPRRGLRAGRAEAQGRHLAQRKAPRAAAASTTTPPTRSTSLNWYFGEPTGVGGTVLPKVFSADIDDEVFSTLYFDGGRTGAALRQLVRRVVPQDDDADQRSGARRGGSSPTARRCQVYLRDTATIPGRLRAGLERPLHHRADRAGLVLPARRGVQRPDRVTSSPRSSPAARRASTASTTAAATDRDDRDDDRRRRARVDAVDRRPSAAPRARGARRALPDARRRCLRRRSSNASGEPDGPAALRRQPVLRRQPHVRGEGARPGDALPGHRRRDGRPRRGLRRGHAHVHVHDPRPHRARSATTCAPTPSATRTSSFYPCMPYAHKYANAVTEDGMLGAVRRFLPDEGLLRRRDPRRPSLATQGHRGHDDAADRRRDEDVRRACARR